MVLQQIKWGNSFLRQKTRLCFYYGKLSYIVYFCYKAKNKEHENVNNGKIDDKIHEK